MDIVQSRFGKIDQFGWWDLEIISADAGTQFTLTGFKDEFQARRVCLTLASPEHQKMNGQVEVTWRTLRTIAHALMVHARVPEIYVHLALMYTTDHIFPVLPIKYLINEDGDTTTPHKLSTGKKPSVSHLRVLFCPCVVRKDTANVETKTLYTFVTKKKRVSRYLRWYSRAPKKISCVRTHYKKGNIFIRCCI